jgi:hypothetical protein
MNAVRPACLLLFAIGVLSGYASIYFHSEPLRWIARVSFAVAFCIAMPVALRSAIYEGNSASSEVRALREHQPLKYWGVIAMGIVFTFAAFIALGVCIWYAPWAELRALV